MRTLLVAAIALSLLVPAVTAAPLDPEKIPEPASKDIYLPQYQSCLWKGSYKPLVSTPVVTVWHYTCDNPWS